MPVLTKQLSSSSSFEGLQFGIGLWRDSQQKQTYFYCISASISDHSDILRINVDDPVSTDWEFVGTLDFYCDHYKCVWKFFLVGGVWLN
jgi:hypothetical protein